jgi:hypothetical protein
MVPYDSTIAREICERIADGHSVKEICKDINLVSYTDFRRWRETVEECREMYREAKRTQSEAIYSEIQHIEWRMAQPESLALTDLDGNPILNPRTNIPLYRPNPDYINGHTGSGLIRSLQWRAEKAEPDLYGSKVHVKHEDVGLETAILKARERLRNTHEQNTPNT